MSQPRTIGDAVEQWGYSVLMLKVADLAHAVGRLPMGEWDYPFASDEKWRLLANGGTQPTWTTHEGFSVPRFHVLLVYNGWPAVLFDAAGGTLAGVTEDQAIAALDAEIQHRVERQP